MSTTHGKVKHRREEKRDEGNETQKEDQHLRMHLTSQGVDWRKSSPQKSSEWARGVLPSFLGPSVRVSLGLPNFEEVGDFFLWGSYKSFFFIFNERRSEVWRDHRDPT